MLHSAQTETTLKDFIKEMGGADKVALKLKCTPQVVRGWLRKAYTPRPPLMRKLVLLSKGRVTYQQIVMETNGWSN